MGSCFDKKHTNPEERTTFLGEPSFISTRLLLYKDVSKEVITEEDSLVRGSSYSVLSKMEPSQQQTDQGQPLSYRSQLQLTLLQEFQKQHVPGDYIRSQTYVEIRNVVTSRNLHSHAIKKHQNYDVCTCVEGDHENDLWSFNMQHIGYIENGQQMLVHHKLTRANMMTSNQFLSKSRHQTVQGSLSTHLAEDDVWVIELVASCKLQTNVLFRLKHKKTEGYLHSGKHHGVSNKHFEVDCCQRNDLKDLWYIDRIHSE